MTTPAGSQVRCTVASGIQHAAHQALMHRGLSAGGLCQIKFIASRPTVFAGANENEIFRHYCCCCCRQYRCAYGRCGRWRRSSFGCSCGRGSRWRSSFGCSCGCCLDCAGAHILVRNATSCMFRGFVAHFAEMTAPAGSEVCDALTSVVQHAAQQTLFNRGLIAGGFLQKIFSVLGPALFAIANKDETLRACRFW